MTWRRAKEEWIFYLQLGPTLPIAYYGLSIELKKRGITLIPVSIDQLMTLFREQDQTYVLCHIDSCIKQKLFEKKYKKLISYLINSERVYFYHFSTFENIIPSLGAGGKIRERYFYMRLPYRISMATRKIEEFYNLHKRETKTWPGGRRAKLPVQNEG